MVEIHSESQVSDVLGPALNGSIIYRIGVDIESGFIKSHFKFFNMVMDFLPYCDFKLQMIPTNGIMIFRNPYKIKKNFSIV